MVYIKAITALALVLWLNYVQLCWKHCADRRRREITRRRRQQARIRRNFLYRRHARRYYLVVAYSECIYTSIYTKYVLQSSPQGAGASTTCSISEVCVVQTAQLKLVGGSAGWKIWQYVVERELACVTNNI